MRVSRHRANAFLLLVILGLLFAPVPSWAQDSTSSTDSTQPKTSDSSADKSPQAPDNAATGDTNQADSNSTSDYTSLLGDDAQRLATQMPIGEIGRPGSLSPEGSPLHFGPIYDTSFSMFYVLGNGLVFNPTTNVLSTQIENAGVFKTTLVYDRMVRRNRFAIQYSPEMVIINGRLEQNLSNQAVSLDTVYLLSPRWSVWLSNAFNTQSGVLISDDPTLEVDTVSGQTSQNPFLQSGNQYISDRSAATFRYTAGARDSFTFTPSFLYEHTDLDSLPTSSYTTGGTATWNHVLTRTQSFGLFYGESYLHFSRILASTLSTSFGVGYSLVFAPTWQLTLSMGSDTEGATGGRVWTYTSSAALYKSFRRSSVALQYYRGIETGPFLSNLVGSEASLGYSVSLTRRLRAGATASYQTAHTSQLLVGKTTGTYFSGDASWQLTSRTVWFVNYGRRDERGGTINPVAGQHFVVTSGIRWQAHRNTSY